MLIISFSEGGGFFIFSESSWMVKGIVSSSTFDSSSRCDVTRYAVFTNVVKFLDWIQDKIKASKFKCVRSVNHVLMFF